VLKYWCQSSGGALLSFVCFIVLPEQNSHFCHALGDFSYPPYSVIFIYAYPYIPPPKKKWHKKVIRHKTAKIRHHDIIFQSTPRNWNAPAGAESYKFGALHHWTRSSLDRFIGKLAQLTGMESLRGSEWAPFTRQDHEPVMEDLIFYYQVAQTFS